MKFIDRPILFTATNQRKLIASRSDISDDDITIDGIDYSVKKRELLPEESMWHSYLAQPAEVLGRIFWQTPIGPSIELTEEEKKTNAKSALRGSIIKALKVRVPQEDIRDMIDIAITYIVMDE